MTTPSSVNSPISHYCLMIKLIHHSVHQLLLNHFGTKVKTMYQNQQINNNSQHSNIKGKNEMIWKVNDTQNSCEWNMNFIGRRSLPYTNNGTSSTKKLSETCIINMLVFVIDTIFVILGWRVFQQTVGIPMGKNCAPLLGDLFLYSYEADFLEVKCFNAIAGGEGPRLYVL
jgi:hypothetical protein